MVHQQKQGLEYRHEKGLIRNHSRGISDAGCLGRLQCSEGQAGQGSATRAVRPTLHSWSALPIGSDSKETETITAGGLHG